MLALFPLGLHTPIQVMGVNDFAALVQHGRYHEVSDDDSMHFIFVAGRRDTPMQRPVRVCRACGGVPAIYHDNVVTGAMSCSSPVHAFMNASLPLRSHRSGRLRY